MELNYIHYEVTRLTFEPPPPLFDACGVPIRHKFDVMLSYNWGIQSFVRDVFMDFHMQNLKVWMDVWGGMQGNINDAMANAVESSSVIICFLTEKYMTSPNCCLELKYSLHTKKSIILILPRHPPLQVADWIQEATAGCPIYYLSSVNDLGKMVDGVSQINRIGEKVREFGMQSGGRVIEHAGPRELELKDLYEDALWEIALNEVFCLFLFCFICFFFKAKREERRERIGEKL